MISWQDNSGFQLALVAFETALSVFNRRVVLKG
jgi:hypothetical protein